MIWSLIPTIITLGTLGFVLWLNVGTGNDLIGYFARTMNFAVFCLVPSMGAWLIWALARLACT